MISALQKDIKEIRKQMDYILHITEAINMNESVDILLQMYLTYLQKNMGISNPLFALQIDGVWRSIELKTKTNEIKYTTINDINFYTTQKREGNNCYIIEVKHKEEPIALSFIPEKDNNEERQVFITSITNIIAVAIENKRLFKRQIEQERFRKEIELASEVQKMLIPGKIPRSKQIEIASIYKPQLNIGGDYFDFIEKEPGIFVFCVADISGKGVGAALLMANFQAALRHAVSQYPDLTEVIIFLNKQLLDITNSERIITMFLGQYNTHNRELEYINAGHTPPFLVMNDTIEILKEGTTLLGAFETLPHIKKAKTKISKEALLMAYTDGLTDLQNDAGVYFDEYCLEFFLMENHQNDVEAITQALLEEMDKFKGHREYPDDIAILVCKLKI